MQLHSAGMLCPGACRLRCACLLMNAAAVERRPLSLHPSSCNKENASSFSRPHCCSSALCAETCCKPSRSSTLIGAIVLKGGRGIDARVVVTCTVAFVVEQTGKWERSSTISLHGAQKQLQVGADATRQARKVARACCNASKQWARFRSASTAPSRVPPCEWVAAVCSSTPTADATQLATKMARAAALVDGAIGTNFFGDVAAANSSLLSCELRQSHATRRGYINREG